MFDSLSYSFEWSYLLLQFDMCLIVCMIMYPSLVDEVVAVHTCFVQRGN